MWVPDCNPREPQVFTANLDRLINDFPARPTTRNLVARKDCAPHLDEDHLARVTNFAVHGPALGLNREALTSDAACIPEVPGKDPQAVPALLRFRAIGIQNAQPESAVGGPSLQENPIGSNAEVAITDPAHSLWCETGVTLEIADFERQVVIAECLVFAESHRIRLAVQRRALVRYRYGTTIRSRTSSFRSTPRRTESSPRNNRTGRIQTHRDPG